MKFIINYFQVPWIENPKKPIRMLISPVCIMKSMDSFRCANAWEDGLDCKRIVKLKKFKVIWRKRE